MTQYISAGIRDELLIIVVGGVGKLEDQINGHANKGICHLFLMPASSFWREIWLAVHSSLETSPQTRSSLLQGL